MERNELIAELEDKGYTVDDLSKLQKHNWVDRGAVLSCEGAAHPNHRAFKR